MLQDFGMPCLVLNQAGERMIYSYIYISSYLSIFSSCLILVSVDMEIIPGTLASGRNTLWMGLWSIVGKHADTFTPG